MIRLQRVIVFWPENLADLLHELLNKAVDKALELAHASATVEFIKVL